MPRGKQGDARSKQTEKRLEMYNSRAQRDKKGRIIYQEYQSKDKTHEARVQPDRRWFGPARTVPQQELQKFQEDVKTYANNPNTFIIKAGKVPYSLLREPENVRLIYLSDSILCSFLMLNKFLMKGQQSLFLGLVFLLLPTFPELFALSRKPKWTF